MFVSFCLFLLGVDFVCSSVFQSLCASLMYVIFVYPIFRTSAKPLLIKRESDRQKGRQRKTLREGETDIKTKRVGVGMTTEIKGK